MSDQALIIVAVIITVINLTIITYRAVQVWRARRARKAVIQAVTSALEAATIAAHQAELARLEAVGDMATADQLRAHLRDTHKQEGTQP